MAPVDAMKRWARPVLILALLAAAVAATRALGLGDLIRLENVSRLKQWIEGFGALAPAVFMAGYVLAVVFFAPGLPITVLGGVAFGPVWGTFYVWIAATIGAALAFLVARYAVRSTVEGWVRASPRLSRLDEQAAEHGWRIVMLTRLVPLFPFNLQNYAYGLTRIGFWPYAVTSSICMLPGTAAFTFAGGALSEGRGDVRRTLGYLAVAGVLLVLVSLIPRWLQRRSRVADDLLKAGWLLLAVMLGSAIGAPIDVLAQEKSMVQLPVEGELPSLGGATGWLNSAPLTTAGLRGKVVLIDVWTYTCINWLRTLPYVRAWSEKYKDQGLVVIGVHAPEFAFEKRIDNVRRAAKDLRVAYPIAIDNDYAIWRALQNEYWPALYFVDAKGRIRHRHFGEGDYDRSERVIQQLLSEAGPGGGGHELVSVDARGVEAAADWGSLRSPENYVGYGRTENFASPGGPVSAKRRVYATPAQLKLNQWALSGDWTVQRQFTVLNKANGRIVYRFHARDLHLVMGPAVQGTPVRFRVLIDGQPPKAAHGIDVDEQGNGTVTEERLYQLIRQPQPIADRRFEIEFLDPGVAVFAFTFG